MPLDEGLERTVDYFRRSLRGPALTATARPPRTPAPALH